jgi:CheY-like chemotaxis protein
MRRIAVIEDEEMVRLNLLDLLEFAGYEARGAADGPEGIRMVMDYLPDAVLCDICMPGKDGYEVLAALKLNPSTRTIPFLFLTARAEPADVRKGMDLGADAYLTKPFCHRDLMQAIEGRLARTPSGGGS